MAIQQKKLKDAVWLVQIDGRLDQSQTPALDTQLTELLDNGRHFLIIDLKGTSYINSGGLRCLVSAWRKARQLEGNLVLSGLNSRLLEIFTMIGFDKVFQIYPTHTAAQKGVVGGK